MINLLDLVARLRIVFLIRLQARDSWGRKEAYVEFEQALSDVLCGTGGEGTIRNDTGGASHIRSKVSQPPRA